MGSISTGISQQASFSTSLPKVEIVAASSILSKALCANATESLPAHTGVIWRKAGAQNVFVDWLRCSCSLESPGHTPAVHGHRHVPCSGRQGRNPPKLRGVPIKKQGKQNPFSTQCQLALPPGQCTVQLQPSPEKFPRGGKHSICSVQSGSHMRPWSI